MWPEVVVSSICEDWYRNKDWLSKVAMYRKHLKDVLASGNQIEVRVVAMSHITKGINNQRATC
jgi:hypothetical protein